jgi:hypothetical protein
MSGKLPPDAATTPSRPSGGVVGPGSERPSLVRGAPFPCRSDPKDGPGGDFQGLWDGCQEKLSNPRELFLMLRPLYHGSGFYDLLIFVLILVICVKNPT